MTDKILRNAIRAAKEDQHGGKVMMSVEEAEALLSAKETQYTDKSRGVLTNNRETVSYDNQRVLVWPEWMHYALKGEKITAIRKLRDESDYGPGMCAPMDVMHAKVIVERFINCITTRAASVSPIAEE